VITQAHGQPNPGHDQHHVRERQDIDVMLIEPDGKEVVLANGAACNQRPGSRCELLAHLTTTTQCKPADPIRSEPLAAPPLHRPLQSADAAAALGGTRRTTWTLRSSIAANSIRHDRPVALTSTSPSPSRPQLHGGVAEPIPAAHTTLSPLTVPANSSTQGHPQPSRGSMNITDGRAHLDVYLVAPENTTIQLVCRLAAFRAAPNGNFA